MNCEHLSDLAAIKASVSFSMFCVAQNCFAKFKSSAGLNLKTVVLKAIHNETKRTYMMNFRSFLIDTVISILCLSVGLFGDDLICFLGI
jgi:hypothetical protein